MIPNRVKLSGFLSYKDEQTLSFASASIWMLSGLNGSGKSSIFDGVTYALFGHHRGGSQNAIELINKGSTAFAVEFDFTLDGILHRIRRTLKRSARGSATGTQQIFRQEVAAKEDDGWLAVPDTNKKVDFDLWIREKIGLNYDTFTSSVLLLQGKAEKLLDSKPSGRAEVLASIVNLERFQKLYDKANEKKLVYKAQLEVLSNQAAAVPEVSDLDCLLVRERIAQAEATQTSTQEQVDTLLQREHTARQWTAVQTRLTATREKLRVAEALLSQEATLQADFTRIRELKDVMPAVETVVKYRGKDHESKQKTERLTKQHAQASEHKTSSDRQLDIAKKKRATLRKTIEDDEKKIAVLTARLRELAAILQTVRLAETQESEVKRLTDELKQYPADPTLEVKAAQVEADRLTDLNRVQPILQRLHDERSAGANAKLKGNEWERKAADIKTEGEQLKAQHAGIMVKLEFAKQARLKADEEHAAAAALETQARGKLKNFDNIIGTTTCNACGQPLTANHLADEKRHRETEFRNAEVCRERATQVQTVSTADEKRTLTDEAESNKTLETLREKYTEATTARKQAATDAGRHLSVCTLAYAELPEPFQSKVAATKNTDWFATTYPARDELSLLRQDLGGLEVAKRLVRAAQDRSDSWRQLRAKLDTTRDTLDKLRTNLPSVDLASIREEQATKQSEELALVNAIKGTKASLKDTETQEDIHGRDAQAHATLLADLNGKLQTEEVTRKHCDEMIEKSLKGLPTAWQLLVEKAGLTEHHAWKTELDSLHSKDTEANFQRLERARNTLDTIRGEVANIDEEAAEFSEDARLSPEQVKEELVAVRRLLETAMRELHMEQRSLSVLEGYREQRAKLSDQTKSSDAEYTRYKVIAELLGRDRLQRHLVRTAERQIVDCANGVLDRLSSGQLFLKLVGSDDSTGGDRSLELEAINRIADSSPINVMFLSGSQKFRVAVSLALGIGQYASKQHRPIESVIIDEGFGCLDRQGRQVMIQELQNLRGHLKCILLVSHQEEFADAFADGYRFELKNGTTTVTRFVR